MRSLSEIMPLLLP